MDLQHKRWRLWLLKRLQDRAREETIAAMQALQEKHTVLEGHQMQETRRVDDAEKEIAAEQTPWRATEAALTTSRGQALAARNEAADCRAREESKRDETVAAMQALQDKHTILEAQVMEATTRADDAEGETAAERAGWRAVNAALSASRRETLAARGEVVKAQAPTLTSREERLAAKAEALAEKERAAGELTARWTGKRLFPSRGWYGRTRSRRNERKGTR